MAAGLRDGGFEGEIALVGAEPVAPYERPHLSKGYLLGTTAETALRLRPPEHYVESGIELVLGERAAELDLAGRQVRLESGGSLRWDLLCLSTGSSARRLPGFEGDLYLRELDGARALTRALGPGKRLDIVGAGFIGCEVAAAAVRRGSTVRVHEVLEQPLIRVLGPELGSWLAGVHRAEGVDLRLGVAEPPARSAMPGAVLVGAGSIPNTELAESAGLEVDRGIRVDAAGRTPAEGVFAAGDATRFDSPHYGLPIRAEHYQSAQRQGFATGRTMAGAVTRYDEVPWFWSDQYGLNLQYAGAGLPWDELVVRGALGRAPFTVFYVAGGEPVAVAGVNDHHTVARARRAMERRVGLSRAQMEDPAFDLRRALR